MTNREVHNVNASNEADAVWKILRKRLQIMPVYRLREKYIKWRNLDPVKGLVNQSRKGVGKADYCAGTELEFGYDPSTKEGYIKGIDRTEMYHHVSRGPGTGDVGCESRTNYRFDVTKLSENRFRVSEEYQWDFKEWDTRS